MSSHHVSREVLSIKDSVKNEYILIGFFKDFTHLTVNYYMLFEPNSIYLFILHIQIKKLFLKFIYFTVITVMKHYIIWF